MRTFVLGDVHGAHRALMQVLDRSGFNRGADRLIFLGDVADGWPETRECIDELLTIPNLVHLLGNHDDWFRDALEGRHPGAVWLLQGGLATVQSYGGLEGVPESHREYLREARLWFEEDGRMFVHGGWAWYRASHPMAVPDSVLWDRELWNAALARAKLAESAGEAPEPITRFREVYVGHTSTTRSGFTEPVQRCEVWNLDQGAGWEGRLSIMDVESKEFWQSDVVAELYPECRGRG
jgi:serine/threonine protein phosphatase 1